DSAPHRTPATSVSAAVAAASARLAGLVAARYGAVFTTANGARSGPVTVVGPGGNQRMTHYYGFDRTTTRARGILEGRGGGGRGAGPHRSHRRRPGDGDPAGPRPPRLTPRRQRPAGFRRDARGHVHRRARNRPRPRGDACAGHLTPPSPPRTRRSSPAPA